MTTRVKPVVRAALVAVSLTLTAGVTLAQSRAPTLTAEQRFQRIEDRESIEELLITYGRLLDKEDLAGYSKLFARDGVWEGGIGSAKGPAEIQAMLEAVFARTTRAQYVGSYHIMSDIIIDVDGDTASSWSRWTWIVEGEDGKPVPQRSGHYEDTFVRENGEWKFKYRLTVTELPTAEKDKDAAIWRKDHRSKE
jgi:ketosteroid isomerase-like protein